MKQGAMKSFLGNVFVRMNEGRLTPELMYTPASAFLQFFGGSIEMQTLELDGLLVDLLSHGGPWNGKFKLYGYQICKVPKSLKVGHWLNQVETNQLLLSLCEISWNINSFPPGVIFNQPLLKIYTWQVDPFGMVSSRHRFQWRIVTSK